MLRFDQIRRHDQETVRALVLGNPGEVYRQSGTVAYAGYDRQPSFRLLYRRPHQRPVLFDVQRIELTSATADEEAVGGGPDHVPEMFLEPCQIQLTIVAKRGHRERQ